jgi:type IV fimbrial biogenesis protein FimT
MNRFTLGERVFPSVRRFVPTIFCRLSGDRRTTKVHPSEKGFTLVTFGQDMSVRRNKGFTLIEILMVILILAIIGGLAVPSVQEAQANARARGAAADLVTAMAEARNQAGAKQRNISLTRIGGDWANGWIMNLTIPIAGVPDLAAHRGLAAPLAIVAAPDVEGLVFLPNGLVETNLGAPINTIQFQVCDDSVRSERGLDVWVSRTGRTGMTRHADAAVCNP